MTAEVTADVTAEETEGPRVGFFARLFGRKRAAEPVEESIAEPATAEPEPSYPWAYDPNAEDSPAGAGIEAEASREYEPIEPEIPEFLQRSYPAPETLPAQAPDLPKAPEPLDPPRAPAARIPDRPRLSDPAFFIPEDEPAPPAAAQPPAPPVPEVTEVPDVVWETLAEPIAAPTLDDVLPLDAAAEPEAPAESLDEPTLEAEHRKKRGLFARLFGRKPKGDQEELELEQQPNFELTIEASDSSPGEVESSDAFATVEDALPLLPADDVPFAPVVDDAGRFAPPPPPPPPADEPLVTAEEEPAPAFSAFDSRATQEIEPVADALTEIEIAAEPLLEPEPIAELEPLAELEPEPLAELEPEPMAELEPEPMAEPVASAAPADATPASDFLFGDTIDPADVQPVFDASQTMDEFDVRPVGGAAPDFGGSRATVPSAAMDDESTDEFIQPTPPEVDAAAEAERPPFFVPKFRSFYNEIVLYKHQKSEFTAGFATAIVDYNADLTPDHAAQALSKRLQEILELQQAEANWMGGEAAARYPDAQYAMAVLADEMFTHMDWPGREAWPRYLLEQRMYRSHAADVEFFKRVDRLLKNEQENPTPAARDLARLYLLVLASGFRGKYRVPNLTRPLAEYRRRLYEFVYERDPLLLYGDDRRIFPQAGEKTLASRAIARFSMLQQWAAALIIILVGYTLLANFAWKRVAEELLDVTARVEAANRTTSSDGSWGSAVEDGVR